MLLLFSSSSSSLLSLFSCFCGILIIISISTVMEGNIIIVMGPSFFNFRGVGFLFTVLHGSRKFGFEPVLFGPGWALEDAPNAIIQVAYCSSKCLG